MEAGGGTEVDGNRGGGRISPLGWVGDGDVRHCGWEGWGEG